MNLANRAQIEPVMSQNIFLRELDQTPSRNMVYGTQGERIANNLSVSPHNDELEVQSAN